jgi:hypothetical protein
MTTSNKNGQLEPGTMEIRQLIDAGLNQTNFNLDWDALLELSITEWGFAIRERLVDRLVFVNGRLVSGLNSKVKLSEHLKSTLDLISSRHRTLGEFLVFTGMGADPEVTDQEIDMMLRLASQGVGYIRTGVPEYRGNLPELVYLKALKAALVLSVVTLGTKHKHMSASTAMGFLYSMCAFIQQAAVTKTLRSLAPAEPVRGLRRVV